MAQIVGLGNELPKFEVAAQDIGDLAERLVGGDSRALFERLIRASRIRHRRSVLALDELLSLRGVAHRQERFAELAPQLGAGAARKALAQAHVDASSIGALITVTSTGFMTPSLDAHLANLLKLDPSCRRIPMVGLGCAGGVAALTTATQQTAAQGGHALVVCVELPSLSLPLAEPTPADVVAMAQLGDGAAAVVVSARHGASGPVVFDAQSTLFPDTLAASGSRLTDDGLRLIESAQFRQLVSTNLRSAVAGMLHKHDLEVGDVDHWLVHPRSWQLVQTVGETLRLSADDLTHSVAVWEERGNALSSTILIALENLERLAPPTRNDIGVMLALGSGVSCELALLRW